MIYFLYGVDTFRSWQKLSDIRKKFSDDALANTNISIFEAKGLELQKFDQAVQSMPFLADKKIIIIKNIFSDGSKDIQTKLSGYLDNIPKNNYPGFNHKLISFTFHDNF